MWLFTGIAEILGLMIGKNSGKERKEKKACNGSQEKVKKSAKGMCEEQIEGHSSGCISFGKLSVTTKKQKPSYQQEEVVEEEEEQQQQQQQHSTPMDRTPATSKCFIRTN